LVCLPLLLPCTPAKTLSVKLASGSLAVFSPVALTPTVRTKLASLSSSPVSYLIAPDLEHHIFLSAWHAAFPSAHVIGPEGLAEKRAEQMRTDKSVTNVPFSTILKGNVQGKDIKVSEEFDKEFEIEYFPMHPNKEIVFYHKPSKVLIEADLLFNLPATEQYSRTGIDATSGWATKLIGALQQTSGTAIWQKRMMWYVFSRRDREGFNQRIKRVGEWGFETVVPCHGDVIPDGQGVFRKVFEWHLMGKK
jgi:hypothetical protein